jgi:hypothetical protein
LKPETVRKAYARLDPAATKNMCARASSRPIFGRDRNVLSRIMAHADRILSTG